MINPFIDALYKTFIYRCNKKNIALTNEKTLYEHGRYFVVICDKCCNIPVLHILKEYPNS